MYIKVYKIIMWNEYDLNLFQPFSLLACREINETALTILFLHNFFLQPIFD